MRTESQIPGLETAGLKLELRKLNLATRGLISESANPGLESPIRHSESQRRTNESRAPALVTRKPNSESRLQGAGFLEAVVAALISRASSALTSAPSIVFASARRVASATNALRSCDNSLDAIASAATSLASTC